MNMIASFHEVLFPAVVALGASAGPVRRTEVVALGSGHEQRNARWVHSRRRYDAGVGIRSIDDLHAVIAFFEARGGRLFGFRFRDPVDCKSCPPGQTPAADDQLLGEGDGTTFRFELLKRYGTDTVLSPRLIRKPVTNTVTVAVDGVEQTDGVDFIVDETDGSLTFQPGSVPEAGAAITAGYVFDVPVRFDTDEIVVSLRAFEAGNIPSIPLVEIIA